LNQPVMVGLLGGEENLASRTWTLASGLLQQSMGEQDHFSYQMNAAHQGHEQTNGEHHEDQQPDHA
jgi:hypothetical protein